MQITDADGNTWTATAVGIDGKGRAVIELRDERGIPAPRAPLCFTTLTSGRRARRWLRYHSGIDVPFDAKRQHVGDLGRLARELNA